MPNPTPSTCESAVPAAPARSNNRRAVRTRNALRDALAVEIHEAGGLDRVVVASLAERADVTRRTFYSHFKDIPDLVEYVELELLHGIEERLVQISATTLDQLYEGFKRFEPCPGSVELLTYIASNGAIMSALLGPGGDPNFAEKVKRIARVDITERAMHNLDVRALGPFFDYYLAFAVSAVVGVIQKWLEDGLNESPELMARAITFLMFVRPGDLYNKPVDLDVPLLGMIFSQLTNKETQ